MKVYALSDPHLSFGVPGKSMDRFGSNWIRHPESIKRHWAEVVRPEDIVLMPGDLSWAKQLEQAIPDLEWIGQLPGRKVLLRGNHDHWWPSPSLLEKVLPNGMDFIQNGHVKIGPFLFFGSRLWDTQEYSVFDLIEWDSSKGEIPGVKSEGDVDIQEKLYERELLRLQLSIASLAKYTEGIRIGLSHYPPLGLDLKPSRASSMFRTAGAQHVVFGHLHSVKKSWLGRAFGDSEGVNYHLCSCDYLDFKLKLIAEA